MTLPETSGVEDERAIPVPVPYRPTSPWDGLSIYQASVAEKMHRAAPELPLRVIRGAVSWVSGGELERHYGVAYSLAYSIRAALREGALAVCPMAEQPLRDTSACRLIDGPFAGAEVLRSTDSILLTGEGVPEGMVARYRFTAGGDGYTFDGYDKVAATILRPRR